MILLGYTTTHALHHLAQTTTDMILAKISLNCIFFFNIMNKDLIGLYFSLLKNWFNLAQLLTIYVKS